MLNVSPRRPWSCGPSLTSSLPQGHLIILSPVSLQSNQELIPWILTLIQWDPYNPLSDYGNAHRQVCAFADARRRRTHTRVVETCSTFEARWSKKNVNTWCTSPRDWCPCKSSAKNKQKKGFEKELGKCHIKHVLVLALVSIQRVCVCISERDFQKPLGFAPRT